MYTGDERCRFEVQETGLLLPAGLRAHSPGGPGGSASGWEQQTALTVVRLRGSPRAQCRSAGNGTTRASVTGGTGVAGVAASSRIHRPPDRVTLSSRLPSDASAGSAEGGAIVGLTLWSSVGR